MEHVKQPYSQDASEQPGPPPGVSTSSTTTELTAEELELIRRHRASTREASPTKKSRTEPGWEEFLDALSNSLTSILEFSRNIDLLLKLDQTFRHRT